VQVRQDGPLLDDSQSIGGVPPSSSSALPSLPSPQSHFQGQIDDLGSRPSSFDAISLGNGSLRTGFAPSGQGPSSVKSVRSRVSGAVRLPAPRREGIRGKGDGGSDAEPYVLRGGFKMPASTRPSSSIGFGDSSTHSMSDTQLSRSTGQL